MFCWIPYIPVLHQIFDKVTSWGKYHIAKKHSKAIRRFVRKSKICDKDFHNFYLMQEHGAQKGSGARTVDVAHLLSDVDDKSLKEELEPCKHFLVDSEMKNGRHRVYNCALGTLDPK